ncbi:uncharacterized protein SPSK_09859 [Sporothrix schenckii 1099-18]|uniref:Uncharacterized protein n=1 Tax=Sporothrix schenckii 1099-18 TaxID=1397361 RepID=A0A0F2M9W8_SPOSC|nr:uncharacterized protein SPSK_09859 [Sporothrix schenckii 1099-18]KJR85620.1 hypothetical protein SPSK_09859 [Sporothrix schenckii 1099-18]
MQPFILLSAAAAVVGSFASIAQATPIPEDEDSTEVGQDWHSLPTRLTRFTVIKSAQTRPIDHRTPDIPEQYPDESNEDDAGARSTTTLNVDGRPYSIAPTTATDGSPLCRTRQTRTSEHVSGPAELSPSPFVVPRPFVSQPDDTE